MNSPLLGQELIKELKEKLLKEKGVVLGELEGLAKKDDHGDWKTQYKDIGSDWDENAQEVTEYATNIPIEETLAKRLKNIEEALARMERNEYGFCSQDGEPIPPDRLRANPETTTCFEHAK